MTAAPLDQPFALVTIASGLLVLDAPAALQVLWLLAVAALHLWSGSAPDRREAETPRPS